MTNSCTSVSTLWGVKCLLTKSLRVRSTQGMMFLPEEVMCYLLLTLKDSCSAIQCTDCSCDLCTLTLLLRAVFLVPSLESGQYPVSAHFVITIKSCQLMCKRLQKTTCAMYSNYSRAVVFFQVLKRDKIITTWLP